MVKESPCKDCKINGCGPLHDHCIQYQEWKNSQKDDELTISHYYRRKRARWRENRLNKSE